MPNRFASSAAWLCIAAALVAPPADPTAVACGVGWLLPLLGALAFGALRHSQLDDCDHEVASHRSSLLSIYYLVRHCLLAHLIEPNVLLFDHEVAELMAGVAHSVCQAAALASNSYPTLDPDLDPHPNPRSLCQAAALASCFMPLPLPGWSCPALLPAWVVPLTHWLDLPLLLLLLHGMLLLFCGVPLGLLGLLLDLRLLDLDSSRTPTPRAPTSRPRPA